MFKNIRNSPSFRAIVFADSICHLVCKKTGIMHMRHVLFVAVICSVHTLYIRIVPQLTSLITLFRARMGLPFSLSSRTTPSQSWKNSWGNITYISQLFNAIGNQSRDIITLKDWQHPSAQTNRAEAL